MRILLLCHAFNSLSQRVHAELRATGHEVSVELGISDEATAEADEWFRSDAVVAPFLKRRGPYCFRCRTQVPALCRLLRRTASMGWQIGKKLCLTSSSGCGLNLAGPW